MKKVFKMMALALVAGAMTMFVACDPETPENPNDTTPTENPGGENPGGENPGGGETNTDGITFNFDGESWTADYIFAANYAGSYLMLQTSPNPVENNQIAFPVFSATMVGFESGNDQYDEESGFLNGVAYSVDYFESRMLTDGQNQYGDWWGWAVNYTVNNFDATANTFEGSISGTLVDAAATYLDGAFETLAEATQKPYTCSIKTELTNAGKGFLPVVK